MSEFGSVLDDLYAGTAPVQIADVAVPPKPKDPTTSFVQIGAVVLVLFAILFLLSKLSSKKEVVHEVAQQPVYEKVAPPVYEMIAKEPKAEQNVFSITGIIPIAEEENVEDHKISADKLDPAIEKYLARE